MQRILKLNAISILLGVLLVCVNAMAEGTPRQLPQDLTINKEAGRGGWLVVKVRVGNGGELPFIVDTVASFCVLDKSFAPQLGKRLHSFTLWSSFGKQESGLYPSPTLFLGDVRLRTGPYIATFDFKKASSAFRTAGVMGIIGLDCLTNYCIQLDFTSAKMRFLNSTESNTSELGDAYSLELSGISEKKSLSTEFLSVHRKGLVGGTNSNLVADTGYNNDGAIDDGVIKGHYLTRLVHFFIPYRDLRIGKCEWNGEVYRKLRIGTGWNALGLRFLARHLVTFDFPSGKMYLKKISASPLPSHPKLGESNPHRVS